MYALIITICINNNTVLTSGQTTGGSQTRTELLSQVETTLSDEARSTLPIRLVMNDGGAAEKKRQVELTRAGILTPGNSPGYVCPPCPKLSSDKWVMLKWEHLEVWFYCFTLHTHTSHSVHSSPSFSGD